MDILYVTDLHGHKEKYKRLFETAREQGVAVVINGGDILPHCLDLFDQGEFITSFLDPYFRQYDQAGIHFLCTPGNDDLMIFDDLLEEICRDHPFVNSLAQRRIEIEDYEFIGMNWVVDYPFPLKDRCRMDSEDYIFQEQYGSGLLSTLEGWRDIEDWPAYARTLPPIEEEMNRLVRPKKMSRTIYNIHMPPSSMGLDECGFGPKVGSKAIYSFLEKHQPLLSLHGHIHESPGVSGKWKGSLGTTICLQPGQLEPFTYVEIDLQTMHCERRVKDI